LADPQSLHKNPSTEFTGDQRTSVLDGSMCGTGLEAETSYAWSFHNCKISTAKESTWWSRSRTLAPGGFLTPAQKSAFFRQLIVGLTR